MEIEKWQKNRVPNREGVSGALLTGLCKAFNSILFELLLAKLVQDYIFDYNFLQMLQSQLSNRKQRTKIADAYGSYCENFFGVPQGFILETVIFNTYICDMFYDINQCDIASDADDNTPYANSGNLDA